MSVLSIIKRKSGMLVTRLRMFQEFYDDYKHYQKWNFGNPYIITKTAKESRILRQTHMIEKGLSLSDPRVGFGQEKISSLFDMLDEYVSLGFSTQDVPFQNAILVLKEYVVLQRKVGYQNSSMEQMLSTFEQYVIQDKLTGIIFDSHDNIMQQASLSFPEFFSSRHSMRQFSDKDIDVQDVYKAIKLAQRAPTACNRQASRVYMYTNPEVNKKLGTLIAGNTGFENDVKNYLVVTADASSFSDAYERNQLYVEAGIFTMALVEALHYYGIASCILQNGEFKKKNADFKAICRNISDSERIVLFVAIGYYKDSFAYAASLRKNPEDIMKVTE